MKPQPQFPTARPANLSSLDTRHSSSAASTSRPQAPLVDSSCINRPSSLHALPTAFNTMQSNQNNPRKRKEEFEAPPLRSHPRGPGRTNSANGTVGIGGDRTRDFTGRYDKVGRGGVGGGRNRMKSSGGIMRLPGKRSTIDENLEDEAGSFSTGVPSIHPNRLDGRETGTPKDASESSHGAFKYPSVHDNNLPCNQNGFHYNQSHLYPPPHLAGPHPGNAYPGLYPLLSSHSLPPFPPTLHHQFHPIHHYHESGYFYQAAPLQAGSFELSPPPTSLVTPVTTQMFLPLQNHPHFQFTSQSSIYPSHQYNNGLQAGARVEASFSVPNKDGRGLGSQESHLASRTVDASKSGGMLSSSRTSTRRSGTHSDEKVPERGGSCVVDGGRDSVAGESTTVEDRATAPRSALASIQPRLGHDIWTSRSHSPTLPPGASSVRPPAALYFAPSQIRPSSPMRNADFVEMKSSHEGEVIAQGEKAEQDREALSELVTGYSQQSAKAEPAPNIIRPTTGVKRKEPGSSLVPNAKRLRTRKGRVIGVPEIFTAPLLGPGRKNLLDASADNETVCGGDRRTNSMPVRELKLGLKSSTFTFATLARLPGFDSAGVTRSNGHSYHQAAIKAVRIGGLRARGYFLAPSRHWTTPESPPKFSGPPGTVCEGWLRKGAPSQWLVHVDWTKPSQEMFIYEVIFTSLGMQQAIVNFADGLSFHALPQFVLDQEDTLFLYGLAFMFSIRYKGVEIIDGIKLQDLANSQANAWNEVGLRQSWRDVRFVLRPNANLEADITEATGEIKRSISSRLEEILVVENASRDTQLARWGFQRQALGFLFSPRPHVERKRFGYYSNIGDSGMGMVLSRALYARRWDQVCRLDMSSSSDRKKGMAMILDFVKDLQYLESNSGFIDSWQQSGLSRFCRISKLGRMTTPAAIEMDSLLPQYAKEKAKPVADLVEALGGALREAQLGRRAGFLQYDDILLEDYSLTIHSELFKDRPSFLFDRLDEIVGNFQFQSDADYNVNQIIVLLKQGNFEVEIGRETDFIRMALKSQDPDSSPHDLLSLLDDIALSVVGQRLLKDLCTGWEWEIDTTDPHVFREPSAVTQDAQRDLDRYNIVKCALGCGLLEAMGCRAMKFDDQYRMICRLYGSLSLITRGSVARLIPWHTEFQRGWVKCLERKRRVDFDHFGMGRQGLSGTLEYGVSGSVRAGR